MWRPFSLLKLLILIHAFQFSWGKKKKSQPLCPNDSGAFVGLAVDENAYEHIPGSLFAGNKENAPSGEQQWILTDEKPDGPKNSFAGKYLQVLPDIGRTYPTWGEHHIIKSPDELKGNSPYVSFTLHVTKETAGWHILFVRWTGGDTVGGGDSMYITMHKIKGKKRPIVTGQKTIKPAVAPIESTAYKYAGCCYDSITHACPCHEAKPEDTSMCPDFIETERASKYGAQCPVGPGIMDIIQGPKWYLYAGQEMGNVMDFDSEPWDATCEAEGSNTRDSGENFPSWDLEKGDYELRIYAREDGTALDAIYIAGPGAEAPNSTIHFTEGDSTICQAKKSFTWLYVSLAVTFALTIAFFTLNEIGRDFSHSVMGYFGMDKYHSNAVHDALGEYDRFSRLEEVY